MTKVLAIDPGYERLGIAVVEKNGNRNTSGDALLYSDCFKTDPKLPHEERLHIIGNELSRIMEEHKPSSLCLESLFFSGNQKTAIKVAEARGVILFQAAKHGLKVFEYGPGEIKVAVTGYGKSDKSSVIAMVKRLINIKKDIAHDDEYDAIAIAITCLAIEKSA